MRYAYYPGCSLESTAREYDVSSRLVLERLGVELVEIPDWTCCGASAAEAVSELLSLALPARNLALAARDLPGLDVLAPCSACYLNLLRAVKKCGQDPQLHERVNQALSVDQLHLPADMRVRHILDVLVNDVGPRSIAEQVTRPLEGIVLAPYYGCQVLRPYPEFDDPERPQSMATVLQAMGATVLDWGHAGKCCGASLMATHQKSALRDVREILEAAREADAVVTVCPMCHMNLEAYQKDALGKDYRTGKSTIVYLPQLMGLAVGMSEKDMRLSGNMAVDPSFVGRVMAGIEAREEAAPPS